MTDLADIETVAHRDHVHVEIDDIDHDETGKAREGLLILTPEEAIEFAEDLLSAARDALRIRERERRTS